MLARMCVSFPTCGVVMVVNSFQLSHTGKCTANGFHFAKRKMYTLSEVADTGMFQYWTILLDNTVVFYQNVRFTQSSTQ